MRRKRTHGEYVPPNFKCATSIRGLAANYARARKVQNQVAKRTWEKPRATFLKLNVDAAFNEDDQAGASGAIIRDSTGAFVAASSKFIPHVATAGMAEALAMCHGLELAVSIGANALEAQSDSTEVIYYCLGQERMWNEATAVYADCLENAGIIGKVEFTHCSRDVNMVAHEIARSCLISKISCNWVDEPPSFILERIVNDLIVL
jgi:ribonuclease HI